ncbi:MAG: hypothetical protein C4574_02305 [Candidatus Latescibacterota bacterium]|jgi:hypothetical protein|nr:MAG: hypothetical protein C4574_02305 [Candidatus Latescibacterota bacterium]
MSRFRELLREANAKLDLPQPERSRILLEIAADMEDLYALYRERGASEEEAVARAVEKFALSDEALADLVRVHRTALQRLLGGVSDQARTRWERILVAFVVCFALAASGRPLLATRLVDQANAFLWPVAAFGAAVLVLAAYHAVRLYIPRTRGGASSRGGIHWILALGTASIAAGFAGSAAELYRETLRSAAGAGAGLARFVGWALGASATLIASMLVAIVAAVIWFLFMNKVKRIEIAEASWLID